MELCRERETKREKDKKRNRGRQTVVNKKKDYQRVRLNSEADKLTHRG